MSLAARIPDVIAANRATPALRVGVALRWIETGDGSSIGRIGLAALEHAREADSSLDRRGRR